MVIRKTKDKALKCNDRKNAKHLINKETNRADRHSPALDVELELSI